MKRFLILIIAMLICGIGYGLNHYSVVNEISTDKSSDNLPDPDRPYFDNCGNEFDANGKLIAKGNGCILDQQIILTPMRGK